MPLYEYSYVLAIGTFFAILDAYNNGASEYDCSGGVAPVECGGNSICQRTAVGHQIPSNHLQRVPILSADTFQTMWPTLGRRRCPRAP